MSCRVCGQLPWAPPAVNATCLVSEGAVSNAGRSGEPERKLFHSLIRAHPVFRDLYRFRPRLGFVLSVLLAQMASPDRQELVRNAVAFILDPKVAVSLASQVLVF